MTEVIQSCVESSGSALHTREAGVAEVVERVAAGPHVVLSVDQCRLIAEHLGLGPGGWRRVSAAWSHAMANGKPVDPEMMKPPGASIYDSPAERAEFAALSSTGADR